MFLSSLEAHQQNLDFITSKIKRKLIMQYNLEDSLAAQLAWDIFDTIEASDCNIDLVLTHLN